MRFARSTALIHSSFVTPLRHFNSGIDQTGVGLAVSEIFGRAGLRPIVGIVLTGGREVMQDHRRAVYHVPKIEIVGRLRSAAEEGHLEIAHGFEQVEQLMQEIALFKTCFSDTGAIAFEHRGEGSHADLVLATALACWYASYRIYSSFIGKYDA